jgi:hypothetical protein
MGSKPPLARKLWKKTSKFLLATLIPKRFILGLCLTIIIFNLSFSASAATIDPSGERDYTDTFSTIALSDYPDYFDTFTVYWENDVFANTDRNYTNGFKFTWSTPYLLPDRSETRLPHWSYPIINSLPFVNDPADQRAVSISLGQNIYTPVDTQERDLIEDDRPYAGYSYFAVGFHSKDRRRQNTWEFDIGVVGPYSGAGQYQNFVHAVIDSPSVKGWNKGRFSFSYAYVYRTKEFEDQDKPQVFGAITLSFMF